MKEQNINFLQVAKHWSECGHCHPEKYTPSEHCNCKCHVQPNKLVEWEKKYAELIFKLNTGKDFTGTNNYISLQQEAHLRKFIRFLLNTQHEQMVEKVKSLKVKAHHSDGCLNTEYPSECDCIEIHTTSARNQALEDVLLALNPKE